MEYIRLIDYEKALQSSYLNRIACNPSILIVSLIKSGLIIHSNYHVNPEVDLCMKDFYNFFEKKIITLIKSVFGKIENDEVHQSSLIVEFTKLLLEDYNCHSNEQIFLEIESIAEKKLRLPFIHLLATIAVHLKEYAKENKLLIQNGNFVKEISAS